MTPKFIYTRFRSIKRWPKKRLPFFVTLLVISTVAILSYMQNKRLVIDPTSYTPLLQVIAKAESNNNYNAYFGNANNTKIMFTNMSISEVMQWQANYIRQGSPSSAIGRYQIVNTTLDGLVRRLGIDTGQKFDQAMQDKLAIALLERRGAEAYINKELTLDEFAANLAKEWAALPKVLGPNPHDSYYASDGLNKSRITVDEIKTAIEPIKPQKSLLL